MLLNFNRKHILLRYGFLFIVIILTATIKSILLSLSLFLILISWDRRFILPILLLIPLIESLAVVAEGYTITKFLSLFIGGYFLVFIIFRKPVIDKNAALFSFFISLTLLATFYGMMGQDNIVASQTSRTYLFTVFPKLLFALLLYLFIVEKGIIYLEKSLKICVAVVPISLIIISIYFIWWGFEASSWWNIVTRHTLKGADPNEFGGLLSVLAVFPSYVLLNSKDMLKKTLALIAIVFLAYSITLTLSRGAILTFIFMGVAIIALTKKFSFTETTKYAILGIAGIVLLIQLDVVNLGAIQERFVGSQVEDNLNSLTAGRTTVWLAGIDAFTERPILGYGNSNNAIFEITSQSAGKNKVMHNLYFEILLRMGLIGLTTFFALLIKSQMGIIRYLKFGNKKVDGLYILPMIALLTMLFSALGLSWQWRELLWYLIAISLASSRLIAINIPDNLLNN